MDKKLHYYAYKTYVDNKPSYALLPISEEAVYVDGMFYTEQRFLLLLSKEIKEKFNMVPKLDNLGSTEVDKRTGKERMERVRMDMSYEFYISNLEDIEWFSESFIVNSHEFVEFVKNTAAEYDKKIQDTIKDATTESEAVAAKEQAVS